MNPSALLVLALAAVPAFADDPPSVQQLKSDPNAQSEPVPPAHHAPAHHMHMPRATPGDCQKAGYADRVSPDQQKIINGIIATSAHRLQHALWHAVRGGMTPQETQETVTAFGASWGQDHPYCPPPILSSTPSGRPAASSPDSRQLAMIDR